jgi:hypothetical protein
MNADQIAALRVLLAPTGWLERTRAFARALRQSSRSPQGLLVLGTPADEPWHMTAHLADESRLAGIPELEPTLIRWAPPADAPPHLRHGIDRLAAATRTETLLVVSGQYAPAELLERLNDVRKIGTTIFALDQGDAELDGLANEALAVPPQSSPMSFDAAQHLVTAAVGEPGGQAGRSHGSYPLEELDDDDGDYGPRHASHRADRWDGPAAHSAGRAGRLRSRLARILDTVSGSEPDSA